MSADADGTLIATLIAALDRNADRVVQRTPIRGRDEAVADQAGQRGMGDRTGRELMALAAAVAVGLTRLGLRTGEPVLIWSENRDRWLAVDLALLALGAPSVPRGADAPVDEIAFIVEKVRARIAFVERPELLARFATTRHSIETVVLLSGAAPTAANAPIAAGIRVVTFEALIGGGSDDAKIDGAIAAWRAAALARQPDEIASIVFTSGTTGRPKGVVLTQDNLASNLRQVLAIIGHLAPGGHYVSILPPWHTFERMVEHALLSIGVAIVYSDRRHFARDLQQFRPRVMAAVPRVWLNLMDGVRAKLATAPKTKRKLVETALALAARRGLLGALMRRTVLAKLRRALALDGLIEGLAISGGGSLPVHVDRFFGALGVPLLNGYGLTETSPVLALRRPGFRPDPARSGTVGAAVTETELEIRDLESGQPLPRGRQGVIHARGPQVMRGYFEEPEATARALRDDGWFDTGDLGVLDERGELAITGRAKDTIVLLSGENIEPEPIENALMSSPLIEQAIVVGQDQKQLGALIVARKVEGDPAAATSREELLRAIRREIDRHVAPAAGFRAHERIARFTLLDAPLTLEAGFLSQTLKIKRAVVHARFAAEITALFTERA